MPPLPPTRPFPPHQSAATGDLHQVTYMASGITSFPITHRNPCLRHPRLYFASPNALGEARERSERVGVPCSLSATTTTTTTNTPLGGSLGFFPPVLLKTPWQGSGLCLSRQFLLITCHLSLITNSRRYKCRSRSAYRSNSAALCASPPSTFALTVISGGVPRASIFTTVA